MEGNHAQEKSPGQSAGRPVPEPVKSRSTRLQETIDRVRGLKSESAEPVKPERLIHRVRNEHSEREMSTQPWCGAELIREPSNATILNCDVTCPECIEAIGSLEVERGVVDLTHFDAGSGRSLCGVSMSGAAQAQTLRETRCEHCLAVAEEVLVGIIKEWPSKLVGGGETVIELAAIVRVLRDICETAKALVEIERQKAQMGQGG